MTIARRKSTGGEKKRVSRMSNPIYEKLETLAYKNKMSLDLYLEHLVTIEYQKTKESKNKKHSGCENQMSLF